jgi:asparagine N-glycosylation enzyme membrane subunit Stt3
MNTLSDSAGQSAQKRRNVAWVLAGVAVLLLKPHYAGPAWESVQSYAGNIAASFAVYFIILNLPFPPRYRRAMTAALGLTVVELFEATNGFGFMTNTYDPLDLLANGVGIVLAFLADILTSRQKRSA